MRKKLLSLALLFLTGWAGMQAQLLWKISGKGLAAPSYVFGTNHLSPLSIKDRVEGLDDAFAAATQVCGEIEMAAMTSPAGMQRLQAAMTLPDGKTLKDVMPAADYAKADSVATAIMGVGLALPQLAQLSPSALVTNLTTVLYVKRHPGVNPMEQLDTYFQTEAQKAGKKVRGLETLDFQIDVLFGGKTMERQVEELMCFVNHVELNADLTDSLSVLYERQDIEGLVRLAEAKQNTACDPRPEELDRLIYDRNADWLTKMPAIMAEGTTLFVVGAGHLGGERGVLALLRKAGYDVVPVSQPE